MICSEILEADLCCGDILIVLLERDAVFKIPFKVPQLVIDVHIVICFKNPDLRLYFIYVFAMFSKFQRVLRWNINDFSENVCRSTLLHNVLT